MSLKNQLIAIVLCFLISFIYIRGVLYGVKRYQLNNSAYKKRKKGEPFKEWLFYSRYKAEIPKILLVLYYSVLILHPACISACLFARVIALPLDFGQIVVTVIAAVDAAWMLVIVLLFWSPGRDYAYEHWITKKRGQKKKKK